MLCVPSPFYVDMADGYDLYVAGGDDRRDTTTGDWAPGEYKAECADGDVLTGLAQTTNFDNSWLQGARCSVAHHPYQSCQAVVCTFGDDRLSSTGGDWSYGYNKLQCPDGWYVKGVSLDYSMVAGLLCCE